MNWKGLKLIIVINSLLFVHSVGYCVDTNVKDDKIQAVQESKSSSNKSKNKTVTMSALDAVKLAGNLVEFGDYERAQQILFNLPKTNNLPVEIERWYLLAQIEQKKVILMKPLEFTVRF